jgi:flagella basal body P-ring formation protein FlgA
VFSDRRTRPLREAVAALASLALFAAAPLARAGSEGAPPFAGGTLVVAPALRELLVALVSRRAGVDPTQIVVPSLNDFRLPAEQAAAAEVDLSVHESEDFSGPTEVTVVVKQGDAVLKRGVVSVSVKRPQRILVAARRIARGDVIEASDLEWREVPEARAPREAVRDPEALVGRRAARQISAGQPWRPELVTDPPLVARGELVRVRIESGALQIDALGEARSDGRVGERMRVRNPDSKREIVGILAADGVVHVHF